MPFTPRLIECGMREQRPIETEPYDRWVSPDGACQAEFYRSGTGYLVRFPHDADFEISAADFSVRGWSTSGGWGRSAESLYENAITPLIGNHLGGLFLHGSAALVHEAAVAFVGMSRSGKTTLAGAFAKAGHPFMTEDVIDLSDESGEYQLRPRGTSLRLFKASAGHLLETQIDEAAVEAKRDFVDPEILPSAMQPAQMRKIYILGQDLSAPLSIAPLPAHEALPALLPHAFILDVEDKPRLAGHFDRLARLAEQVEIAQLDYPRDYSALPQVIAAILSDI